MSFINDPFKRDYVYDISKNDIAEAQILDKAWRTFAVSPYSDLGIVQSQIRATYQDYQRQGYNTSILDAPRNMAMRYLQHNPPIPAAAVAYAKKMWPEDSANNHPVFQLDRKRATAEAWAFYYDAVARSPKLKPPVSETTKSSVTPKWIDRTIARESAEIEHMQFNMEALMYQAQMERQVGNVAGAQQTEAMYASQATLLKHKQSSHASKMQYDAARNAKTAADAKGWGRAFKSGLMRTTGLTIFGLGVGAGLNDYFNNPSTIPFYELANVFGNYRDSVLFGWALASKFLLIAVPLYSSYLALAYAKTHHPFKATVATVVAIGSLWYSASNIEQGRIRPQDVPLDAVHGYKALADYVRGDIHFVGNPGKLPADQQFFMHFLLEKSQQVTLQLQKPIELFTVLYDAQHHRYYNADVSQTLPAGTQVTILGFDNVDQPDGSKGGACAISAKVGSEMLYGVTSEANFKLDACRPPSIATKPHASLAKHRAT